jgi:hypothetical protein
MVRVYLDGEERICQGYVWIKIKNKWIFKHRWIMECYLNRKLKKEEVIHHLDYNKLNNELNNLIVLNYLFHNKIHKLNPSSPFSFN